MSREIPKPFLIAKDEAGVFRLTVREVRYNSQGYPLVSNHPVEESFKTARPRPVPMRASISAPRPASSRPNRPRQKVKLALATMPARMSRPRKWVSLSRLVST